MDSLNPTWRVIALEATEHERLELLFARNLAGLRALELAVRQAMHFRNACRMLDALDKCLSLAEFHRRGTAEDCAEDVISAWLDHALDRGHLLDPEHAQVRIYLTVFHGMRL